jgi:xanthine dehydrogenase/oxidase
MTEFFQGYRKTALAPDAIIASLRIPAATEKGEHMRAYKQSKRKDDDIAIVNAALRVSMSDTNDVTSCNLVFGGMAPLTVSAKNAEAALIGQKFANPATLEAVMSALEKDFNLPFGVPGGMATYRKSLAMGFFYRFYHDVLSGMEVKAEDMDEDVVAEIERAISSGKQDGEASVAYQQKILGQARPHVAALKQSTGQAQYTDDIPVQQNELFACMVLSTKAHAKILSVDASEALEIPGVSHYIDHTDMPSPEANWWGAPVTDEQFFAVDEVRTAGQPIGVILAHTAKIA